MLRLIPRELPDFLTADWAIDAFRLLLFSFVGFLVVQIVARLVGRFTRKRLSPQSAMLLRKGIVYTGMAVIAVNILSRMGVNLAALLGAAGIVGIAVGIASQTSMSNLISGIFLISEKPFTVGDLIKVGDTTGVVLSVDLLSVKIRRFNNEFVRIPNEKIISSELVNISRYPIRRMDISLSVAYKDSLERVREILLEIADGNPFCLTEPEPIFIIQQFGDSGQEILFGIWFEKSDFLALKNSMMIEIKRRFDAEGIEIPFPHRTLYTGSATEPFPVRVVESRGAESRSAETGAGLGETAAAESDGRADSDR